MTVSQMNRRDLDDEMIAKIEALGLRANRRGTMCPENNDPDAGTTSHGDAVQMIYDEIGPQKGAHMRR